VTTTSTHRWRGLASQLIAGELAASVERGEHASILIPAEWRIYGRFGYGAATEHQTWTVDASAAQLQRCPPGTVEYIDRDPARALAQEVHDRHRATRPGEIARSGFFWDLDFRIVRFPSWSEPQPSFSVAARDQSGLVTGVARYRVEGHWEYRRPRSEVAIQRFLTCDAAAGGASPPALNAHVAFAGITPCGKRVHSGASRGTSERGPVDGISASMLGVCKAKVSAAR
jgi:hypothetical protein